MALNKYPGETPDRSAARNVGTPGEEDRGIFTTAIVRAKGSEIIFDLDATQYGESIDLIDRGTLTRYKLGETTDGRLFLEASPPVKSAGMAELLEEQRSGSVESYLAAASQDEQKLKDLMHPASREEVDHLLDVAEIASFENGLPDYDMEWLDFYADKWRDALENTDPDDVTSQSELDYQDQASSPQQKLTPRIVFSALRNYLKKYRDR